MSDFPIVIVAPTKKRAEKARRLLNLDKENVVLVGKDVRSLKNVNFDPNLRDHVIFIDSENCGWSVLDTIYRMFRHNDFKHSS